MTAVAPTAGDIVYIDYFLYLYQYYFLVVVFGVEQVNINAVDSLVERNSKKYDHNVPRSMWKVIEIVLSPIWITDPIVLL